jgi:hypothetical protein
MPSAKQRLQHFLALAYQGPAKAAELAAGVADFIDAWPEDAPPDMREAVLTLLDLSLRDADDDTRLHLAAKLGGRRELPLDLVNEFYLSAPAPVRHVILERNDVEGGTHANPVADPEELLFAARDDTSASFTRAFASALHVPLFTAAAILADASGEALAVACRGAHLERAHFSALALLKLCDGSALEAFEAPPQRGCESLTGFWQAQTGRVRTAA